MPTINISQAAFDELRGVFAANPQATLPTAPAPIPAPAQTGGMDGSIPYTIDRNGIRVDDVVPPGTPGTVQAGSGCVYSAPMPSKETGLGYYLRCWKQGRAQDNSGAMAFSATAYGLSMYWPHNPASWPFAMDQFLHPEAYMTQAQKDAQQAANAAWSDQFARMQQASAPAAPAPAAGDEVPIA